jgi:iron complex transport system substrate-binding protein
MIIQYIVSALFFLFILAAQSCLSANQLISVIDDEGNKITLNQPARRIISLSPGITELLYAAGGGDFIKGVVSFSNYPSEATKLPEVGSYNALDLEKILVLNPDLVIAWKSGNPSLQIKKLKKLGLQVYLSEPVELTDIPLSLQKLGQLMGTEKAAGYSAAAFKSRFDLLKSTYSSVKEPSRVFIQIWDNPVMSVSGKHLISKVITLCGGENIFTQYPGLTLNPDVETVLQNDPQVIIATGMAETGQQWLTRWKQWDYLDAVKNQRLYSVNPDLLVRHTPRILDGMEEVCDLLSK